jgi:hypothetical protein
MMDDSPAGTIHSIRPCLEVSSRACIIVVDHNLPTSAATAVALTVALIAVCGGGRTEAASEITLPGVSAVIRTEIRGAVKHAPADKGAQLLRPDVCACGVINLCLAHTLHLESAASFLLLLDRLNHVTCWQGETVVPLVQNRLSTAIIDSIAESVKDKI